ncbi:LLM class F420-dependent oxidoreductase [Mycolicibacterium novocastrense]|uniref:TIGR03617 family F420-dependent LLM class oxidoreductase n=1 Tax=Mycolicibacterium novocastrense TaxID=59813 RepID=UPI000747AC7B|nr:TIGR03617 family F420-dependent LLM class oxidoreductase [Mycolicibacterium novocastrense]KUH64535.1 LLM class F420-dependent oxidoreductase [Mycolicibacterium novocastrense]KUH64767.1 LLM class F420-dependent oxidoreductase [Mycolicibacterium novocastrense]KUH76813.1 LLM class F420-dependent oxidoreductase [Mycolicibacterium novocastrense]
MKVMTALFGPTDAIERARLLRDAGASGVFTFEGPHDVFAPLTLASTVGGLDLMTNVAIAFPRNPVQLAHQAYDHQVLAEGRFTLGLGTQVRAQVEKRYGAAFDRPVARMTEMVAALRAVFTAWETGERLDFRGEYFRHTLMTPTFNPGPNPFGPPPIYLGALGPRLTRATAAVADGLLVMPFGSKRFLHEATMPQVRAGLSESGRSLDDFALVPEIIVSVGTRDAAHDATRRLLAFYGSTPAYRPVLDVHGWGELQPELNALSKQGRWQEMGTLIDDEVLHTIAACGTPAEIAAHIRDRVAGVSDRVCLYQPGPIAIDALAEIVDALAA